MATQIKTNKLTLSYGSENIIKDVDLIIPEGKISVLIGANGSGKSTILKALARQLKPASGSVYVGDKSIWKQSPKKLARTIGFLPQSPLIPEGLTVTELIANGRSPHQGLFARLKTSDKEAIRQALEVTNTTALAKRQVTTLSGGQRQRVWVAMVLAQETPILFLDEPTTWLDINHQLDVLDVLRSINEKKGTTIVMVLHELNLAARYADYIFAVHGKGILSEGTPEEVFTPEMLKKVFKLDADIIKNPITSTPLVVPHDRKGVLTS